VVGDAVGDPVISATFTIGRQVRPERTDKCFGHNNSHPRHRKQQGQWSKNMNPQSRRFIRTMISQPGRQLLCNTEGKRRNKIDREKKEREKGKYVSRSA
jgi:hypothetical protein